MYKYISPVHGKITGITDLIKISTFIFATLTIFQLML